MKRVLTIALLLLGCASMQPARAAVPPGLKTLIDVLAVALGEPALSDAAPMIDCVINNGPDACFDVEGLAEAQGKKAVAKFIPTDPMIQAVVAIIQAVNKRDWLKVLELTGTDVLLRVACHAGLTVVGPVQGFVCNGPFDKVMHMAKPVIKTVLVFVGDPTPKHLLAVIESNVDPDLACSLTPEFPGKPELCGALGELVQLGKDAVKLAGSAGKALWYGAGDVLGLNDPKAISQEDYYALAWAPWYHAGTVLCLRNGCKGIGDIAGHVWHPCKDYFASHDMTSSTAQDACDNMRDRKFYPQVKSFAKLMPIAAGAYVEVARPLAKMYAVTDYGSTQMLLKNKATLVQGCVNKLALGFPFPPPEPGRCEAIRQSRFYNSGMFTQVMHQAYSTCLNDAKNQLPSPTAWASACNAAAPKFVALLNEEAAALQQKLPGLAAEGCLPPPGWNEPMGIKLDCRTYTAYRDCLGVMSGASTPQAHCAYDERKADKDIVSKIMAALGHKRCAANGAQIECSRPWKREKCLTLRAQLTSGAPTAIQCKDGPPAQVFAFAVMTQEAKNIMLALNGGASNEKRTTGGLIVKPLMAPNNHGCKTTWDPLAIGCSDPNTPLQVPGHPNFAPCPPTLSEDGVDAPCLRTSLNKHLEQTTSTKEQRTLGVGAGPAPHSDAPPVRLGTSRPGARTAQHGTGTQGRPANAPTQPSVTVARMHAIVEENCRAPAPALVIAVTLRNSGGPLAANRGTVYVKELGGAGLTSGGVHLPAIGAGRTAPALRIPLVAAQPYSSLAGRHQLEVTLEPLTTGGTPSFDKPLGGAHTLYVDIPAGHCQDRPLLSAPKQSIKLAPPEQPLIRR